MVGTVTTVLQVQNDGRADAALAAWNVCHDSAAGIDTQRCLKLGGPGCHDTITAATRNQQAMRLRVLWAHPAVNNAPTAF